MSCQTIYVMLNSFLSEEEKRIVAAHELGHITLHRSQLKMAPMSDNRLYNMINETEYQANLFAADLLIQDEDVAALSKQEDLDYFSFCSSLYATPELMSFKLYSLMKRGQKYNMPLDINSNFLAK
jgi:Zn-dependent peptidase ImmA (M78 family)